MHGKKRERGLNKTENKENETPNLPPSRSKHDQKHGENKKSYHHHHHQQQRRHGNKTERWVFYVRRNHKGNVVQPAAITTA